MIRDMEFNCVWVFLGIKLHIYTNNILGLNICRIKLHNIALNYI